ncbi:MAG: hypothetical protein ACK40G_15490 [Cytophagaceae bacterium]
MVHQNVTVNWVYEHYLAYLYLSIADSDCFISQNEMDNISCQAFKSLDSDRCRKLVKEVYIEFLSHTEEERRAYIKENAGKFLRTESIKTKVIHDLEELVEDKDEESEEQIMFRYIRKSINNAK